MTSPDERQHPDARAVRALAIAVTVLVVVQILASGFLPVDDALRHAGKAVSGRGWDEIVVARPGVVDFSPGWHALLGAVHRFTDANAHTLVWLGIALPFVLFSLAPLLLMRVPEAWVATLVVGVVLEPQLVMRLIIGRPLVLSMAILVTMCFTWRRLDVEPLPKRAFAAAVLLTAAAAWIHGSWYLWALPIIACAITGQRRVALRFAAASATGVILGALLTGHPIAFLWQSLGLALNLRGLGISSWVYEMQPYPFTPMLAIVVPLILIARKVWLGVPARPLRTDPVFALAALGLVLGFKSGRFWMDWGMPAMLAFLALELEGLWLSKPEGRRRLLVVAALGLTFFLVWTANINERWNPRHQAAFRVWLQPQRASAMPDSGGIVYTDDRRVFYEMFYLRPTAPWRYVLGFAPEIMQPDDYAVYVARQTTGTIEALEPWARKLRPEDRLLIRDPRGIPIWNWLEWQEIEGGFYSGRVRRAGSR